MSGLTETAQQLGSDALVTLFTLDATGLGDTAVRRFTSSAWQDTVVRFGGQTYTPTDVEATGFEWQGQGAPPAPGLSLANTNAVLGALARDFDDLVGAEVTRLRTFKMLLDDGASPDADMHFPPDLFRIERKVVVQTHHLAAARVGRHIPAVAAAAPDHAHGHGVSAAAATGRGRPACLPCRPGMGVRGRTRLVRRTAATGRGHRR